MKPPTLNVDSRWVFRAACRDLDPQLFDLDYTFGGTAEAREACAVCPVIEQCLASSIANRDHGVYRAGRAIEAPIAACAHCGTQIERWYKHRFCGGDCYRAYTDIRKEERRKQQARSQNRPDAPSKIKTHCINGHEFTDDNTYVRVTRKGNQRMCRTCKVDATRRTEGRPPLRRTA